jgi:hypothetical protein
MTTMFSKGTTWPPKAPTRVGAFSEPTSANDRLESSHPSTDSTPVAHGDSRTAESDWESVIDRATD